MIRLIAAIDIKMGLADDKGIPWKLPSDVHYFKEKIKNSPILMGGGTYKEMHQPLSNKPNAVLTHSTEPLLPGFEVVHDVEDFVNTYKDQDVWIIGGANLFSQTIDLADELFITQVKGDFNCTKFFPPYKDKFKLKSRSPIYSENNTSFCYEVWEKLKLS